MTPGHDAVALTISDDGWQEEFAIDETSLVLSRVDTPAQRLTIDFGDTGPLLDDSDLAAALTPTFAYKAGEPGHVTIGGTSGFAVDLAPTEAVSISIPGAGAYDLQPDRRYRLGVLQYPMGEESVIEVILVEAPTADFEGFAPIVDAILRSAEFSSGN
ncbi:MAG TPA: hypothetical protein VIF84_01160 [Candidatus Limnocylindrales bacterium]